MLSEEPRERLAKVLYEHWRQANPGTFTWDNDAAFRKEIFWGEAGAIIAAGWGDVKQTAEQCAQIAEARIHPNVKECPFCEVAEAIRSTFEIGEKR